MKDLVGGLERWYAARCEPDDIVLERAPWQHRYGVQIMSIDNPGWSVLIDLGGTPMEGANVDVIVRDNGDDDWIECRTLDGRFCGLGDPSKLGTILEEFLRVVEAAKQEP